jgi:hypothetical protein
MTHAGRRCEVAEDNNGATVQVWSDRTARKEGCIPIVQRGTVPQSFRFLVGLLDGGIDAAQEMLDDMKADRAALRGKHGI